MAGECRLSSKYKHNEATEELKVIKIDMVGPSTVEQDHRHDPR